MLIAFGRLREGFVKRLNGLIAYAARYGKQPRSEILSMTLDELHEFNTAISDLVGAELTPTQES